MQLIFSHAHCSRLSCFIYFTLGTIKCTVNDKVNVHCLDGLELEIESNVGNVVEGTGGQVEPHQLVAGRVLVAHSADVCAGRHLDFH